MSDPDKFLDGDPVTSRDGRKGKIVGTHPRIGMQFVKWKNRKHKQTVPEWDLRKDPK